jgi:hypothetical protein
VTPDASAKTAMMRTVQPIALLFMKDSLQLKLRPRAPSEILAGSFKR